MSGAPTQDAHGAARKINAWSYSGSVPGPMIEVNEGDRVRVVFTNKLPEPTTIHWHGLEIPIEMDGTPYISHRPGMRATPCWSAWRRRATSNSRRSTSAIGCCIAICRTT